MQIFSRWKESFEIAMGYYNNYQIDNDSMEFIAWNLMSGDFTSLVRNH